MTSDGVLVAGTDAGGRAAVVKLRLDGSVLWGPSVIVGDASAAASLALRPDGRIVVAGTVAVGAGMGIFLAELSAAGTLNGVATTRDPTPTATDVDRIVDLHLQASGAAILAREVTSTLGDPQAPSPAVVERYAPSLDPSFGPLTGLALARLVPQPGGGFAVVGATGTTVRSQIVDADGLGDGVVRSAAWGTNELRPATALALADGSLALFGRRVTDGSESFSARLRPDGSADPRWTLATVRDTRFVDAVADGSTALALAAAAGINTVPLTVSRVTLNAAPTAGLTATLSGSTVTLDASGTIDPDGPTDARTYAFDIEGDGTVDVTTAEPLITRSVPAPRRQPCA